MRRSPDTELPMKAVDAGLRKTTERLACELARPTLVGPDWCESEWLLARAAAAMHGVSSLLSTVLRWHGPAGWAQFLEEQRTHTASRHQRICDFLMTIDGRTRAAGVPAMALKGPALHAIGLYEAGERPMADIDLLVREQDLARTESILAALGFRETYATWKDRTFELINFRPAGRFGESAANDIKIELQVRVGDTLPLRAVDISDLVFPPHARPGLNGYPSKGALMTHLLLHAAGAMAFRSLRLLNLHDIALLSTRMSSEDWNEITPEGVNTRRFWWAFPPLAVTARYYTSIPGWVLASMAAECPWLLRKTVAQKTLTDVSLSHLWMDALPGIQWARSLDEVIEYALQRILPNAQRLSARKRFAQTQPYLVNSAWARLSQRERVVRWLTSRPPRPATMYAVSAALAQLGMRLTRGNRG
jgi:hypothetical protein